MFVTTPYFFWDIPGITIDIYIASLLRIPWEVPLMKMDSYLVGEMDGLDDWNSWLVGDLEWDNDG